MTGKSIFLDLEIDTQLMVDSPDEFAQQVYSKADGLLSVLNSKTSLKGAREEAANRARLNTIAKTTAAKYIEPHFESAMQVCIEDMTIDELWHAINVAKEFVRDLELEFHGRANNEMVMNSPNVTDKGLAHHQYMQLRNAFNAWREFAKLMTGTNYPPLDPKSGNYGDANMTYPTYRYKGEVYNNYRAVARLLDWDPDDFHNHQDLVDRLTETGNEDVEVIQVTL